MAGLRTANRYAKGLTKFAKEEGQLEAVYQEMKDVSNTISKSDDLQSFLASPVFDVKKKLAVLDQVFVAFSSTTKKFIALTVNQGRENILAEIADEFVRQYNNQNNIVSAEVTSAVELDQNTLDKLIAKAKESLPADAKINLVNKVDASLIGGFVLRIGNQQIDTSVKSKLATLKKELHS